MGTHNPYANPSSRLKLLAGTFAFLALSYAQVMIAHTDELRAMLIG